MTEPLHQPIIVVSGASGSGKTTLCRRLSHDLDYYYAISHTTRPQRKGETHSKDYHFVTEAVFDSMIQEGAFLEWAAVYDKRYGTARSELLKGRSEGLASPPPTGQTGLEPPPQRRFAAGSVHNGVIVDVDPQGAMAIKSLFPSAYLIFVRTPSMQVLEERLLKRGRDSKDELKKRLDEATREESFIDQYDDVIINDDLELAYAHFSELVIKNQKNFHD